MHKYYKDERDSYFMSNINTDILDVVRFVDFVEYLRFNNMEIPNTISQADIDINYNKYRDYQKTDPLSVFYAGKFNKNLRMRKSRLKARVEQLFSMGNCIFITFTFTDKVLNCTTELTRRRYVVRCLKKMSNTYIANIDYGKSNEREHYHAILVADHIDLKLWKYGFIFAERCRTNSEDKLSTYITKISNHALKKGTKYKHLIYSKK